MHNLKRHPHIHIKSTPKPRPPNTYAYTNAYKDVRKKGFEREIERGKERERGHRDRHTTSTQTPN